MKAGRRGFAGCNHRAGAGVYCFDNPGRKKYKRTIETETKEALLTRKSIISLAICAALLVLCLPAATAGPTGTIKGRILDDKGAPLSGAYLYVTSPAALGVANFMTSKSGRFGILGLVPGTYKIIAEAPGFKTVTMDGIVVSAGATFTANFRMEASPLEEESTTVRPGPGLDRDSARSAVILDRALIERLPLRRDFTALLGLVPGLIFETDTADGRMSLNGAPLTSAVLVQDGIIVTHPTDARIMDRISTDLIDEVVIESAGHTAETGPAQGAYINIVHRPGSAATQGSLSYSASGRGLSDSLWTSAELAEMPDAAPTSLRREHDLSFTLGGPVLEDMAWMFANFRYKSLGRRAPFTYFTDPLGVRHFVYDYSARDLSVMFKMSMNVLGKFKGVVEFGTTGLSEPVYAADVDKLRPEASTRDLDREGTFLARIGGTYVVNPSTRIDLSVGYAKYKQPLLLNEAGAAKPQYFDVISGYTWGSGPLNDREAAGRMRVGATMTRLLDGFLGGFHEVVAGGEYETTSTTSKTWKADNLIYNYAGGSPYTYGLTESPTSGDQVGWGLIGFYIAPSGETTMTLQRELKRIGLFAQDTIKIGPVSLSGGLRFDRSEARFGTFSKGAAGNSVSVGLGSALVDPVLGYNLFSSISLPGWEKAIVWNTLSPRAGVSFDLLGGGRTILKASWARIPEHLNLGYSQDLAQVDPLASHDFIWYDEDGSGAVNSADGFALLPYDFRVYKSEYFRQAVDPDLSAPVIEEWTAGLEQAVGRDFSLAARYIDRRSSNNVGHVVYDPSTGAHWWRLEESPEGWWVPFSTVVPGTDGYPDVTVDLYMPSATAPAFFERIENVPELTARYRSLEFSFRKKMSHNWQAFGSLTWNRATGTTSVASRWSAGNSPVLLTPNSFTNIAATDRLLQDRPLVARLAGTVRFGWDIYASFLFKAQSGAPWARTVTIIPPTSWAAANGAVTTPVKVYLESPGSRRFGSWKTLDFRLEKEFTRTGRNVFSASVDVYNLLGEKYRTLDLNDGGTWAPDGEGASTGTRTVGGTYGTFNPLLGTRVVRLNFSLKF
jgi:hypothetical protein